MEQKTRILLVMVIAAALLGTACDLGGDTGGSTEADTGISAALLSFPSSLSSGTSRGISSRAASDAVLAELNGLYSPVRDFYNPLAEQAIAVVKEYLEAVETNIINNQAMQDAIADTGSWTGEDTAESQYFEVDYDQATSEYTLKIFDTSGESNVMILYMVFSQTDDDDYEGYVVIADLDTEVRYRVNFNIDDTIDGDVTELLVAGLAGSPSSAEPNAVDRIWLKAWQDGTDFHVNANIRYLNVDIEPDATEHSLLYNYVMGKLQGVTGEWDGSTVFDGNYVYRCVAKTDSDIGAVSLGLVDDIETETAVSTLFNDYSIGQIYKNAITEWFNLTDGDYGDSTLVDDMNNIGFTDSEYNTQGNPITTGNLLPSEVMQYLIDYKEFFDAAVAGGIPGAAEASASLEGIIFVTDLTNPGYFDSTGFQGTGSSNTPTPTWDTDLPGETGDIAYSPAGIEDVMFLHQFDDIPK